MPLANQPSLKLDFDGFVSVFYLDRKLGIFKAILLSSSIPFPTRFRTIEVIYCAYYALYDDATVFLEIAPLLVYGML